MSGFPKPEWVQGHELGLLWLEACGFEIEKHPELTESEEFTRAYVKSRKTIQGKRVSFRVDQIHVVHWQSGQRRTVRLDETVDDLLTAFIFGCREAFYGELHNATFRIYALPHDYQHERDVDEKKRIFSSADLLEVLQDQGRSDRIPRELHVFNDADGHSPTICPTKTCDTASATSATSAGSLDSESSLICLATAKFTCAFCGYHVRSNDGVVAAHLFEVQHYKKLPVEQMLMALREKDLFHIHDLTNLVCLCFACHRQFDAPYNIGINPSTDRLEISPRISNDYCNNVSFSSLAGKKVAFAKNLHPPKKLLKYRYGYYTAGGGKPVGGGKPAGGGKIVKTAGKKRLIEEVVTDEDQVATTAQVVPAGYTVVSRAANDPTHEYSGTSSSRRNCVSATAYIDGGPCERCKRWFR